MIFELRLNMVFVLLWRHMLMKLKLSVVMLLTLGLVVCWGQAAIAQTPVPTVIPEDTPVPTATTASPDQPPPPSDRDGDTLIDEVDACPDEFGPVENNGCPVRDGDEDGTPDDTDQCPDEAGFADYNGCLPTIPTGGRCYIATRDTQRVNIRSDHVSTAEVVGSLSPEQIYPVLEQFLTDEGVWYRVVEGWVAGWVVRTGGNCPPPQGSSGGFGSSISSRTRSAHVSCDGTNVVVVWEGLTYGGVYLFASRPGTGVFTTYYNRAGSGIYTVVSSEAATWMVWIKELDADGTILSGNISCPDSQPLQRSSNDLFCGGTLCAAIWFLPGIFPLWLRRRLKKRHAQKAS
jgi:hypothetical protein